MSITVGETKVVSKWDVSSGIFKKSLMHPSCSSYRNWNVSPLPQALRLHRAPLSFFSPLLLLSIAKYLNAENNYSNRFPPTENKVTNQTWWINHCSSQTPSYVKWYWGKKGEGAIYFPFSFKNGVSLVVWRMATYRLFESHSLKHFWNCFHIESQLSLTQEIISLSIV